MRERKRLRAAGVPPAQLNFPGRFHCKPLHGDTQVCSSPYVSTANATRRPSTLAQPPDPTVCVAEAKTQSSKQKEKAMIKAQNNEKPTNVRPQPAAVWQDEVLTDLSVSDEQAEQTKGGPQPVTTGPWSTGSISVSDDGG